MSDRYNYNHSQELGAEDLRGEAQGGVSCLAKKKQNQKIFSANTEARTAEKGKPASWILLCDERNLS